MSGRSPGQTSDRSDGTARSSASTSSVGLLSTSAATQGYVSPYPPIPQSCTTGTASPITALAGPSLSAGSELLDQDDNRLVREYTSPTPQARQSQQPSFVGTTFELGPITQTQKEALIQALTEHRINTIAELRRIERIFATLGTADLNQPMTSAWLYYVSSNSLITELRRLTPNYPFSSECIDEAKRLVYQDPASNRSWNYCWLVLAKVHTDALIPVFARTQAARPEMWGVGAAARRRTPRPELVERLAQAFVTEWTTALVQMLRYWESPPVR